MVIHTGAPRQSFDGRDQMTPSEWSPRQVRVRLYVSNILGKTKRCSDVLGIQQGVKKEIVTGEGIVRGTRVPIASVSLGDKSVKVMRTVVNG